MAGGKAVLYGCRLRCHGWEGMERSCMVGIIKFCMATDDCRPW
jgi:hypothetical protein